jgi:radical SAM protein with 4Fe4S-binding SPASM domain
MGRRGWRDAFLRLHPQVALKNLEQPYLYHINNDELYELNDAGRDFLLHCDGSTRGRDLTNDESFVKFCLKEGLLERLPQPDKVANREGNGPIPSLRYLELQLLRRCNLACRHCYLGPPRSDEIALEDALSIARQFEEMGGLRLLISGGEPLLYPPLREFVEQTNKLKIRRILLTNGTLITAKNAPWLHFDEIQFSLDGWQRGHDMLRGPGAFVSVMAGIRAAKEEGIPVSIATMIHSGNLDEFDHLRRFTEEIDAVEWGIDILCMAGSLEQNRDMAVPYEIAAPLMEFAHGGGYHGSSDGFACGRHLMTVMPTGKALKCGFYEDDPLGDARLGLLSCWQSLRHISLAELECKGCPVVEECAGGCRFRADHPLGPDRAMCAYYGINPAEMKMKRNQRQIIP